MPGMMPTRFGRSACPKQTLYEEDEEGREDDRTWKSRGRRVQSQ